MSHPYQQYEPPSLAPLQITPAMAQAAAQGRPKRRVAFIEWSDPIYVGGHWTPQLIQRAGGVLGGSIQKGRELGALFSEGSEVLL